MLKRAFAISASGLTAQRTRMETVASNLAVRGIGLVSTVVLARLLTPQDFGLVAMALLLYQTLEILGEFNFEVVLVVEQEAGREHYDTVWTLSLIRGIIIAALNMMAGCMLQLAGGL